jgi:hypothetical protein
MIRKPERLVPTIHAGRLPPDYGHTIPQFVSTAVMSAKMTPSHERASYGTQPLD